LFPLISFVPFGKAMAGKLASIILALKSVKVASYLVALLLLALGGATFAYMVLNPPRPEGPAEEIRAPIARVFKAQKTSHRVAVTAYGTSRAGQEWTAIAEVRGRATEVSSRFEPGEILPSGMLLVRIDPTDYELAVARFTAEARVQAEQLRELDQSEANLKEILKLRERRRDLALREYDRQHELFKKNAASESDLEASENAHVAQLAALQETSNSLALIPAKRDVLEASRSVAEARLAQAKRDLSKCEIRLPQAARCASKSIEVNQYVAAGERLGTFLALQTAEVVAMLEVRKIRQLFPGGIKELSGLDLTEPGQEESFWRRIRVPVDVSWGPQQRRWVWKGRFARIGSSLDPLTRTIPVIIEVPDPYKDFQPGIRPPLLPDVFCRITAYGNTVDDVVVIPRDSLHNGRVYLLREGKLHIAPVTVLALEDDLAVVEEGPEGISEGDLVVLADLVPASEGMPLRGEEVPNPVKPRTEIDFPDDIFQVPESSGEEPAARAPADQPPAPGPPAAGRPADLKTPSGTAAEADR